MDLSQRRRGAKFFEDLFGEVVGGMYDNFAYFILGHFKNPLRLGVFARGLWSRVRYM